LFISTFKIKINALFKKTLKLILREDVKCHQNVSSCGRQRGGGLQV
jgi:hypothetical protein